MAHFIPTIPAKEDYAELAALWEASVRATHHFLSEADIEFFRPLILNEYLAALQLFCIREQTSKILGFYGLSGETVEMLFVRPDHFGKGIGKILMRHAMQNGARKVDVNEQNQGALAFYQHLGFIVASRSPLDGTGKPYPILHLQLPETDIH